MRKSTKSKAVTTAWPDDRFKSETPAGEVFAVYVERPFDFVWGIEQWGAEIHGERGPQPFTRTDANGEPVKLKDATGEPVPDPDGPRDPATGKFLHFLHMKDLHDVVVLTGTGPGRGTRHIEANAPDWKLPAGLTLRPPFSEAGQSMLRELGLARRLSDTFEPLPDVLRAVLLTECGVAPERLPHLTGPQIETILREHAGALGLVSEPPAAQKPGDRPALTELEQELLFVFDEREILTTTPQAARVLRERGTGRDEATVKRAVRHLLALGLIERPQTPDGRPTRKGSRVSEQGKRYLATS